MNLKMCRASSVEIMSSFSKLPSILDTYDTFRCYFTHLLTLIFQNIVPLHLGGHLIGEGKNNLGTFIGTA